MRILLILTFLVLCIVQCQTKAIKAASSLPRLKSPIQKVEKLSNAPLSREDLVSIEVTAKDARNPEPTALSLAKWNGLQCILGGALVHLTFGSCYCWGSFLSYIPPYLRYFDNAKLSTAAGSPPDALYVLPFTFIAQSIGMPLGPLLLKYLGSKLTLLLSSWIVALAVYLSSYQRTLSSFLVTYAGLFGLGIGLGYTAPMIAGWKWLPNSKGLVSGGILAGFGAGGFLFSLLGSKLINPNAISTQLNGKFSSEITDRFPIMLRTLAVIYFFISTIGSLLLVEAPPPSAVVVPKEEPFLPSAGQMSTPLPATATGLSLKEALQSSQFWLMWIMMFCSGIGGLNTASVYKQFAATSSVLAGDHFQTLVGGIGALFNGSGRLLWGILADKIGFKSCFTLLTVLQCIFMSTYEYSSVSKVILLLILLLFLQFITFRFLFYFSFLHYHHVFPLFLSFFQSYFALNTFLLFFCLAGNLALVPPATLKLFGTKAGTTIYGLLFSAFAVASISGGFLTKSLVKVYGFGLIFKIMAGMSLVSMLLASRLTPITSYEQSSIE
jgi:OFA family oxalate/formate antiporter-like MFS transporter